MPFSQTIQSKNMTITNIAANDPENVYTITAENNNTTVNYQFSIDCGSSCYTSIGNYYAVQDPKNETEFTDSDILGESINKFIGQTIDNIYIYEDSQRTDEDIEYGHGHTHFMMIMQVNLTNGTCFYFVMYNVHNGYYTNNV